MMLGRTAAWKMPAWVPGAVALVVLAGCTEHPLSLGSDDVPGAGPQTRDVTLPVTELEGWRDTTLTGFAHPAGAPFVYVSNRSELQVRALFRFDVPDTVRTVVDTLPVAVFENVEFFFRVDTARSEFSAELPPSPENPLTMRLMSLDRPFEATSASWAEAGAGQPWAVPGGDLGVEIASGVFDATADSILLDVTVPEDSLMKAWQEEDGGNGFAIVLDGPEARLHLTSTALNYEPTLVGRQNPAPQVGQSTARTFIHDPPLPSPGTNLRIGGLPASRSYFSFAPPARLGGVALGDATISQAEVILHPLPSPGALAAERPISATKMTLLGDPFETGAKTPIGRGDLVAQSLTLELLESGEPLRLDVTLLLERAYRQNLDGIRFGYRANPDAQVLGYWEFGSAESPPELQPQLRVVFSTPPTFGVP